MADNTVNAIKAVIVGDGATGKYQRFPIDIYTVSYSPVCTILYGI